MIKKNYQSSNLLNFHAHHLNLWFFCANSSFLLRLIVKFSLVLGLFLNYNYNAFWSILLPLPFIIYLNTFVSCINYIFKYICLLHLSWNFQKETILRCFQSFFTWTWWDIQTEFYFEIWSNDLIVEWLTINFHHKSTGIMETFWRNDFHSIFLIKNHLKSMSDIKKFLLV